MDPASPNQSPPDFAGSQLAYARNDGSSIRPTSITIAVSKAALKVSIAHVVAAFILAILLGAEARGTVHEAELVAFLFLLQSPFLAAGLILGVLGHRPIGGREWAGKAMWIAGITPGASALLMLVVALLKNGELDRDFGGAIAAIVVGNAVILLVLRNRILRKPGPLPVIPIEEPVDGMPIGPGMQTPIPVMPIDQPPPFASAAPPLPVLPNHPAGIPYGTPFTPGGPSGLSKYLLIFIPVTLIGNTFLFYFEQADRSWGAMAIAIMVSPVANLMLIVAALLVGLVPRRHRSSQSLLVFLLISIGLPVFATAFNFFALFLIELHGC